MKAVHLLVNSVLPPDLRNNDQTYDIKSLNKILHAVAFKHPDQFADVEKKISDIGRKASYYQGETITLNDLTAPFDRTPYFQEMEAAIKALPKNKDFESNRIAIMQKYNELIEKANAKSSLEQRNNIAMSVLSGARGKGAQLKAMVATPGTFSDYKGRVVPVFSKESFAEGVRPAVFLASTNGARASVVSTKCLDYQSLVKMSDLSEKRLCDIQPGDMVLGADKEGYVFPVKVLNVFDQGEKECYKYTFRYSNSKISLNDVHVTCTEDHKFLVISSREYNRKRSLHSRGNGPAPTWRDRHNKEIHTASKFKRASRASDYNPLLSQGGLFGNKNEPWARVLGLLIGDGCLTGNHTHCTLSCADPQLIEDITPELTALGQKIKKASGDNFTWNITKADYNPTQNNSIVKGVQGFVAGSLMDRNQMLKDYGLLGHYAWEKRFPTGWQSWDEESMKNFIAGLFAADGSVFSTLSGRKDRIQVSICFGMTSEDCLKDLHEALMYGFGISSRFENPTTKGGFRSSTEERVHPLYALEISRAEDVIKFCEVFSDYVPGIKRAKLIEETSKIVIKDHNPYAKVMFLKKEYVGKVHCMDIEVDHPDHLFVLANGLITSNSSTAKGGDLAKQLASAAADLVVRKEDCGTENGIELSIDDKSMRGRVLAKDAYGIKAGTVIGRNELDKLKKAGADSIVVRSPQTCSVSNGLCAHCVGRFYNGSKMPKVGDSIGLLASSTVGEPVCLVKGTEVRMADGSVKKIEDIEPGEYVLGSDMNGYCKPTKVVNKFHNGPRNCYRSYIKKGYGFTSGYITLDSTAEHKILGTVRSSSKPLNKAELNISAIGTMPKSKRTIRMCQSITGSEGGEVHEPMAMLLGMLVGDGSYKGTASGSAKNAVHLSCYDDEQVEILRKELEPLGLLVKAYTTPNEYRIVEADQYNTANWTAVPGITYSDRTKIRNRVRAKLIEEGMWGQDCYTKTLPKSIWSWDMDSVCKFVGGLIATDGYVTTRGTIGYSSNNIELLKQIKDLLQFRLGVYSTNISCKRKKKPDGTYYNPTYEFTINEATNVQHFAEMIKIPGRKAAILTAAAERKPNHKRRGLYKLEKQEWLGVQDTWDLEVDNDTHLFALANGLIVSNTQMALSAKHTAGMSTGKKSYSGLGTIIQFTQSPEAFKDRGAVSELDGKVTSVEEAPQGGMFVTVGDKKHYVLPGHEVYVKPGDTVEAGDQLAEGLVDPEDIVRLKGLGEGKLYYAERLHQMLQDSGAGTDRRNTEVLARGAIRHIKITDPEGMGSYLPDDVVDYNAAQNTYKVPETAREVTPKEAVGKYLQKPYLHYTVGTRVTPTVAKKLAKNKYDSLLVDDIAPGFVPHMVRLRTASHTNPDWMASLATSSIAKQLNEGATRGDDTNIISNPDFRPRLAVGENFGKNVSTTGEF